MTGHGPILGTRRRRARRDTRRARPGASDRVPDCGGRAPARPPMASASHCFDPTPSPWHEALIGVVSPETALGAGKLRRSAIVWVSDDEAPVLLERLAVDLDPAAPAQVADQVGVDGALVLAAGLRVARADRHVDGAADLLVEQDVAGAAVDPVVGADPELAEPAGALVGVEQLIRYSSPRSAPASTTLPASNRSRTPATSRPPTIAGRWKVTSPSTESSTGPVKNSPSGMLCSPSAGDERAPGDPEPDVGARARSRGPPRGPRSSPRAACTPRRPASRRSSGSGSSARQAPIVEVLEVGQAHLGVGGVGVGREERVDPAVRRPRRRAASSSPSAGGSPPGAASGAPAEPRTARGCWCSAPIRDPAVGVVGRPLGQRRDPLELRVGGVLEVGRGLPLDRDRDHRMPARLEDLLVDGGDQRLAGARALRSGRSRPP